MRGREFSRDESTTSLDAQLVAGIKSLNVEVGMNSSYLSITKMEDMGLEAKKGYLMKKSSGILGR